MVLMVDITGFTGRFQEMAALGTIGAEQLFRDVNATFSSMVSAISEFGGHPVSFACEAVTAVFPDGLKKEEPAEKKPLILSGAEFLPTRCVTSFGQVN